MHWSNSLATHIWIFSVGRGNAAFIRSGLNQGFIVDMGEGEDFDPATFVEMKLAPYLSPYRNKHIAQAVLSHPHRDHIAQCARLGDDYKSGVLRPTLLTCPNDKAPENGVKGGEKLKWSRILNPEGSEDLITAYKALYNDRVLPLQTIEFDSKLTVPNLEYGIYYIRPPVCEAIHKENDQEYGNSTSIMFYLRHGENTILFPGDMTPEGMKHVLDEEDGAEKRYTKFDRQFTKDHPDWHTKTGTQPSLKSLLKKHGLTILMAPHHGLESCFPADLYDVILGGKPQLVVISEKRHASERDGKVHEQYQKEDGASGLTIETEGQIQKRRSLSTVNGHHILIVFNGNGRPKVYADKDAGKLLSRLT
jgi:hypothetical protein